MSFGKEGNWREKESKGGRGRGKEGRNMDDLGMMSVRCSRPTLGLL